MSAEYKLNLHSAAGTKVAEVTDFLTLAVARKVNEPGLLKFGLNGDHAAIALLEDKAIVDVWRRDAEMSVAWAREFSGIYRRQRRTSAGGLGSFEATCPGALTKLGWRHVLWYAGTLNRSRFIGDHAETIMKTLVGYNAGSNATVANGRLREGTITGISTEADGGHGNTLDHFCAFDNLLASLQQVARVGGGDFDLVRTSAALYEFRWYTGQLGTDRSSTVTFSLDYGNMRDPVYEDDRIDEKTVVLVGGPGEGSARAMTVVTSADYAAGDDYETFVDATDCDTANGRTARGTKDLDEKRRRRSFTFGVLQTPGTFYGKHYFLGDLVRARYESVEDTFKIVGVTMTAERGGGESIDVELA